MSPGEQMFMGISLGLDASGVVAGASVAKGALSSIKSSAQGAGIGIGKAFQASMGLGMIGAGLSKVSSIASDQFLQPAIVNAKEFEVEMSQLGFVAKSTGEQLSGLGDIALQTGLDTQFSPQESVRGLRLLRAAGLDTKESLDALAPTLDSVLGGAGSISLEEGASATAAGFLKFRHTGESATRMLDSYAEATRNTNLQFADMRKVMNSLRDAPAKLKLSTSEAFGLVGVLRSSGMMANQAGQQVVMFANRFIQAQRIVERYLRKRSITEDQLFDADYVDSKMPDIVYHFKRMGVHMYDLNGKMRNATEFLTELTTKSANLDKVSQKAFATTSTALLGPRSSGVLQAMMNYKHKGLEGAEAMRELFKTIEDGVGASREAAAAFENTTQGMENFIEGTNQVIGVLHGNVLLTVMKTFYVGLRWILNGYVKLIQRFPAIKTVMSFFIVSFVALSAAAGAAALSVAAVVLWTHILGPAVATIGNLAGMWAILEVAIGNAAFMLGFFTGQILPFIGAVILVVAALSAVFGVFSEAFGTSLTDIGKDLTKIFSAITTVVSGNGIKKELYKWLDENGFLGFVTTVTQWVKRARVTFAAFKEGMMLVFMPVFYIIERLADVIVWLATQAMKLLTIFGMSPIRDEIPYWETLGEVMGFIAGVVLTNLIRKSIIYIYTTSKNLVAALWRSTVAFIKFAFAAGTTAVTAMAKFAYASLRYLARAGLMVIAVLTGLTWGILDTIWAMGKYVAVSVYEWLISSNSMIATGLRVIGVWLYQKALILWNIIIGFPAWIAKTYAAVAAQVALSTATLMGSLVMAGWVVLILAAVAAYGVLIYYTMQAGEALGDLAYELGTTIKSAWLRYLDDLDRVAKRSSTAFSDAFKGDFKSLFDLAYDFIDVLTKINGLFHGLNSFDAVIESVQTLIGSKRTKEEEAAIDAEAAAGDVRNSMSAAEMEAANKKQNEINKQFNSALLAASNKGAKKVHIQNMTLKANNSSPEEVQRLAKEIMAEIARGENDYSEAAFQL